MNTEIYWKTITPAVAEELLKLNTKNRSIKQKHVKYLAREMENGRWKENGETIKLNGLRLLDGQHRLLACIKANVPFRTLVVNGLSEDVFDTVDTGSGRSCADTLSVMGEKNTKRLAAALGLVERYFTGTISDYRSSFSNTDIEQLLAKYPDIRASVDRHEFQQKLAPPSVVAACHYLFSRSNPELADRFIEQVLKGHNLQESDPAYVLRERLLRNSLEKAKLSPYYITALFIKAWNGAKSGTRIRYLKFAEKGPNTEAFPVVL